MQVKDLRTVTSSERTSHRIPQQHRPRSFAGLRQAQAAASMQHKRECSRARIHAQRRNNLVQAGAAQTFAHHSATDKPRQRRGRGSIRQH